MLALLMQAQEMEFLISRRASAPLVAIDIYSTLECCILSNSLFKSVHWSIDLLMEYQTLHICICSKRKFLG